MGCLRENQLNLLEERISNYKNINEKKLESLHQLIQRRNDIRVILKIAKLVILLPIIVYVVFVIFSFQESSFDVAKNLFVSSAVATISLITIYRTDNKFKNEIKGIYEAFGLIELTENEESKEDQFRELSVDEYGLVWFLCKKNDVLKTKMSEFFNSGRVKLTYFDYRQLGINELITYYEDRDGSLFKREYVNTLINDIKH